MKYAVLLFDDPAAWENVTESELGALHAQYIAVTVARLQDLDHAFADPHRRLLRRLARPAG